MQERIFSRFTENGKMIMSAKLRLLGIGKYAFETSLFGQKPYETNINMPFFDDEEQAYKWLLDSGKGWKEVIAKFKQGTDDVFILWNAKYEQMITEPFCHAIRFDRGPMDIDNAVQCTYNAASHYTGFQFLTEKRPTWWSHS